jgi:putative hemolysin
MDIEPPSLFFLINTIDTTLVVQLLIAAILLFFSAVFSGSEVALFSLKINHLEQIKNLSLDKHQKITSLLGDSKRLLATILILNNFVNIGIVIVFTYVNKFLFNHITSESTKLILEIGVITTIILVFGEILPKVFASKNNIKTALWICSFIYLLNRFLYFANKPMRNIVQNIENKFDRKSSNICVDDLSQALELSNKSESTADEHKILKGIVTFGNTEASEVMTPRIDLFAIDTDESYDEVIAKINEKGYSRIPVYEESIDKIKGVLYAKDLIPHLNSNSFDWLSLIREPFFVPENIKLDNLLSIFKNQKNHLAIVVDEFGGTSGIITLEDIIEEIVGDIQDEFDDQGINYSKIDENNYFFDGKTNLKDFSKIIDIDESYLENNRGEAETLAGLILEILGVFPKINQTINFGKLSLKVDALDKKRIKQVKVTINE